MLKGVFYILGLALLTTSCSTGVELKGINYGSLFHDGNSKVWMIDKVLIGKKDFSPPERRNKDIIIFFENGKCQFQPIHTLGDIQGRKGEYSVFSNEKLVTLYFDKADNAFISAYRKHHPDGSFEISVEYLSCPDLNNRILIIADPMLATGASLVETIQAITKTQKPKEIHIAVAIASKKGIETVQAALGMDTSIWCGDIDDVVLLFTNQATCDR